MGGSAVGDPRASRRRPAEDGSKSMASNCINRRRGQEGWEELEDYEEERGQEDDHQEGQEFTDASAAGPPEGPEEEGEAGARSAGRRSERCGRRRPGFYPPPRRAPRGLQEGALETPS